MDEEDGTDGRRTKRNIIRMSRGKNENIIWGRRKDDKEEDDIYIYMRAGQTSPHMEDA